MFSHGRLKKTLTVTTMACLVGALSLLLASCREDKSYSINPDAIQMCEEGTADVQAFRFNEAVDKLGHCLELDPSLAEAAISRAYAFANIQDHQSYRTELDRADSLTAAIDDDSRRMLAQLRLSRLQSSRFHDIGDSLRDRMQRQDPNNFYVLEAVAEHAEQQGESETAIKIWLRVLDINPNYASAYNKLGYLELNRGGYDEALDYLQKYIFLAPDLANPHDSYGEGLMTLGRYEEAEKEFRTSIRMQADFYPSLINLGRIYLARGQVKKSTAIFNKIREKIADTEAERGVDLRILTSYLTTNQPVELGVVSSKYIAQYPSDPITPLLRCLILSHKGEHKHGTAIMDSTLAARRSSPQYQASDAARAATEMFASQYEGFKNDRVGQPDKAVAAWAKAIDLMSETTPYYQQFFHRSRLAASHLAAGQPGKALVEIDAMLAVNPRLIEVLRLKTEAHLAQQNKQEAVSALAQFEWALSAADADYPPRQRATELSLLVNGLASR